MTSHPPAVVIRQRRETAVVAKRQRQKAVAAEFGRSDDIGNL